MNKASLENEMELLNIKEAASLLNVSEISLRRWTDSGKMPCFRIGGKRERRFRRQDLLNFLESQNTTTPSHALLSKGQAVPSIQMEGISIDYGKHLCSLYESDIGRVKLSVPFLVDGLRHGDVCFLIAAAEEKREILAHLVDVYGDLTEATETKKLIISEGMDSSTEMLSYLEQQFILATREGSQCLRVLGDMSWFLHRGLNVDDLFDFENHYNHSLAHRYPVVSLCQYDARKFSGTSVVNALKSHEDTFQYPLAHFVGA